MNRRRRTPVAVIVAVPLIALLLGGAVGFLMRDDASSAGGAATGNTTVGRPLPTGDELDTRAPVRPLPTVTDPAAVDPATIVGFETPTAAIVPRGAAVALSTGADGLPAVIDPSTGSPAAATAPQPFATEPVLTDDLGTPAPPESTSPPADAPATSATGGSDPAFADPCVAIPDGCSGEPGSVRAALDDSPQPIAPLALSYPFAAAGGFAATCDAVEEGAIPDPQLPASLRPTIALAVNQPSSLALTGTWSDGTPIEKLTMVTLPAHDAAWQQTWDDHGEQGRILACLTLPLDTVRAHASGGLASLTANVLALSANGRASISGALTLTVPLDGDDTPFVEPITVTGMGELPRPDGPLAPVVHVHYAVANDEVVPVSGSFDSSTVKVYARHAFVENADCSGWAVNRQGLDRTRESTVAVRTEQRTVVGRARTVTIVDGDVVLDATLPGGWEGFLCVQLFARDDNGTTGTIALRGMQVRAPRSAVYQVGAAITDPGFPADWRLDAVWSVADGAAWCGPATLQAADGASTDGTAPASGATCTTYARLAPQGITVTLIPIDASGSKLRPFAVIVPVNTGYCNPDDPAAHVADGCATGLNQTIEVPFAPADGSDGATAGSTNADPSDQNGEAVTVSIVALRTAAPGQLLTNPSHAWRIDPTQAFRF